MYSSSIPGLHLLNASVTSLCSPHHKLWQLKISPGIVKCPWWAKLSPTPQPTILMRYLANSKYPKYISYYYYFELLLRIRNFALIKPLNFFPGWEFFMRMWRQVVKYKEQGRMSHKIHNQFLIVMLSVVIFFSFLFFLLLRKRWPNPWIFPDIFQILPGSADAWLKRMLSLYQPCCMRKGEKVTWLNHLQAIIQLLSGEPNHLRK